MNRTIILAAGAAIAIAVAGTGVFIAIKDKDKVDNSTSQTTRSSQQSSVDNSAVKQGNIFTASTEGKATQCDMTYSGDAGNANAQMFTDGNGRGLMIQNSTTEQGNNGQSNVLLLSDKVYSWMTSSGQTIGFVFDKSKYTASGDTTGSTSGANANQQFNMDCKDWEVDESKLTLPAGVNFTSFPGQ